MPLDYTDLAAVNDMLKEVYGQGLQNQFNDEAMTYNLFKKSPIKPRGKGYVFGVRYSRAAGTGGRGESMKLPDPLTGKKDRAKVVPVYLYGAIRLTGPMIEAAKGSSGAFVDGLSDDMDDIYNSLVDDMNRQCHTDGFGLIATITSTPTLATDATWTATCDNDAGTMYCQEGMLIDFYASTGAADQSAVACRISAVDHVNKTVTFEANAGTYKTNHPHTSHTGYAIAASTIASGSFMVKMGARDAAHATTDTAVEISGLEAIFDDGTNITTFQDISTDSFPAWKALVLGNAGVNRELSIDLMLQALNAVRARSGKKIDCIRMGLGQRRKYANLLMPDIRFAPGTLKGGYETLTFAGGDGSVEIIVDPITRPNKMYFEPKDAIQKFEMTPLGWGNLDQQMHQRSGYDEWDMFLRCYTNLGTRQRNCLCLMKDLTEPTMYS